MLIVELSNGTQTPPTYNGTDPIKELMHNGSHSKIWMLVKLLPMSSIVEEEMEIRGIAWKFPLRYEWPNTEAIIVVFRLSNNELSRVMRQWMRCCTL